MSLPARPGLLMSNLEGFLFADIGAQSNGLPLTVLSLFARAGLDPWEEADLLSHMSRSAAASRLVVEINRASSSCRGHIDVGELAESLVARLPSHEQEKSSTGVTRLAHARTVATIAIFYATLFTVAMMALLLERN